MKITGISHIGIAAKDPTKTKWFFEAVLGLKLEGEELVKEQMTMTQFFPASAPLLMHKPRLELLLNEPGKEGPIAKFLSKKGGGIHHIAFQVDDVNAWIAFALSKGVTMIDKVARNGAHDTRVAFVHPESTGGILIEFVEEKSL